MVDASLSTHLISDRGCGQFPLSRPRTRVSPNVGVAVATQAGRLGAGEGTMKAGRQQSARLSREGRMIGDLALSVNRLRFSE
jgi:hypothetical protein